MPVLLVRSALFLAILLATVLAVVGGFALGVPGLITLLVTAVVVGAVAAGMAREAPDASRASALDVAGRAAGWTAGVLLVLAGLAAIAGAMVTVLVLGAVVATVVAVQFHRAGSRPSSAARAATSRPAPPVHPPATSQRTGRAESPALLLPPVGGLPVRALGEEWLRTTALLQDRLDPAIRRAVVGRRESILDELERRDPAGLARWLDDVPGPGRNPAEHVRDLPAAGTGAA